MRHNCTFSNWANVLIIADRRLFCYLNLIIWQMCWRLHSATPSNTLIRSPSALLTREHVRTARGFHLHYSMLSQVKFTQSEWVKHLYNTYIYKYSPMLYYFNRKHSPVDSSQGSFGSCFRPVGFGFSGHVDIWRNTEEFRIKHL